MDLEIEQIIIFGIFIFMTIGFFLLVLLYLYNKKQNTFRIEKKLLRSMHQEALLQTQVEIQEQTLKNISEEIHDNVGQVLSLAKLHLNTFEDTESELNRVKINDTRQLVSKAINDLRNLSRSLYGDKIAELELHESLGNELKILENTGQYKTRLQVSGDRYKLDPQQQMVVFRIVQESINNAVKHAKAREITIDINYTQRSFKLTVTDNGNGFEAGSLLPTETGIGIKSMQNRAKLIGASLNIISKTGEGTVIEIELKNTNINT
jgi:two-component system, NarL family, sensor kinase